MTQQSRNSTTSSRLYQQQRIMENTFEKMSKIEPELPRREIPIMKVKNHEERQPARAHSYNNKYRLVNANSYANRDPPSVIMTLDEHGKPRKWKGPVSPSSLNMHLKAKREMVAVRWKTLQSMEKKELSSEESPNLATVEQNSLSSIDDAKTKNDSAGHSKKKTRWGRYWKKLKSPNSNSQMDESNGKACNNSIGNCSDSSTSLRAASELLKQFQCKQETLKHDLYGTPVHANENNSDIKYISHKEIVQVITESSIRESGATPSTATRNTEFAKPNLDSRSVGGNVHSNPTVTQTSTTQLDQIKAELEILMEHRCEEPAENPIRKMVIPTVAAFLPEQRTREHKHLGSQDEIFQLEHSEIHIIQRSEPRPPEAEDAATSTADIASCSDKSCNTPGQSFFSPSFAERNLQCKYKKRSNFETMTRRTNLPYPSGYTRAKNENKKCDDRGLE